MTVLLVAVGAGIGAIARFWLAHHLDRRTPWGTLLVNVAGSFALGWLVGVGSLAIPGVGPLIAAGPILAALSGAALGGVAGGLTGALVGLGIPEYEAQQYEGKLREGNLLLSVHADDSDEASRIRQIMNDEQAESISTGSEASVPSR